MKKRSCDHDLMVKRLRHESQRIQDQNMCVSQVRQPKNKPYPKQLQNQFNQFNEHTWCPIWLET
jgi:hypothetical protein